MPRSGSCRECGKRVWLDEAGGCQFGHDPDCISEIEEEPDPTSQAFGEGEFPRELTVFNWGAFFLPAVWGMVYGAPILVGLWAAALFLPWMLIGIVGDSSQQLVTAVLVISQVFSAAARLWAGTVANRLAWRQQMLRQTVLGMPPRYSEAVYLSRQRVWALVGAILTAVSVAALVALMSLAQLTRVQAASGTQLTWPEVILTAAWTTAEVALAAWLAHKMRQELDSGSLTRE